MAGPIAFIAATSLAAASASAAILDNSFFIEEAYNQERGVVQHVQTVHWTWDPVPNGTARGFAYAFTQEWPVRGQRHQLSYTIPYERAFGSQPRASGLADVQIHYRWQALAEDEHGPAFAPRISVLVPTGASSRGLGSGTTGFQMNLPLSKQMGRVHAHLNAGVTWIPDERSASAPGTPAPERDRFMTSFGFGAVWIARERWNVLLEFLTSVEESAQEDGSVAETTSALVSPGIRTAIDRDDGGQWVLGLAAPIGVTDSENDIGLFLYLSFEHPF